MRKEIIDYVHKHNDKRTNNLKYDFMPEILEIIEKPAHVGGKVIIYSVALFILTALIWAGISKVDVIVTANGSVIPEGNLCDVNAEISGNIDKVNISDGEHVEQGDILLELESEEIENQIGYINDQVRIYEAENEVYELILSGTDVTDMDTSGYDEICKKSIEAIIEKQKYFDVTYEYSKSQYGEDSEYLNVSRQQNTAEISENISGNDDKIRELKYELENLSIQLANTDIIAPVSGTVVATDLGKEGTYINASEKILSIIPDNEPLIVRAYVSDADIADIKCGQKVRIKISSYPYSDYGTLDGSVYKISNSAEYVENIGNVYTVEMEIEDDRNFNLASGMSAGVEMKLGKRSILESLFEPIMNKFDNSMKEK